MARSTCLKLALLLIVEGGHQSIQLRLFFETFLLHFSLMTLISSALRFYLSALLLHGHVMLCGILTALLIEDRIGLTAFTVNFC